MIKALAFLDHCLGEASLELCEDASLHVVLGHLFAECLLQTVGIQIKDQFVLLGLIVDPLIDLFHHLVKHLLMICRQA